MLIFSALMLKGLIVSDIFVTLQTLLGKTIFFKKT